MSSGIRRASHAGSWYSDNGDVLGRQLSNWLRNAGAPSQVPARAIIAPHAGYSYSGECGGFAYKQVDPTHVSRVFLLGPSHNYYLDGCALSKLSLYETPIGNLTIDEGVCKELKSTGQFEFMSKKQDEKEHSLEMHLPYIVQVMGERAFKLVPVLVGSLSPEREQDYGKLFAPYLADPKNLFVISSDFCHWGHNFSYTPYDPSKGRIYEFIEWLDRKGMNIIEKMDPVAFTAYFDDHDNTVCGRHPIAVLLNAIAHLRSQRGVKMSMKFLRYAQSEPCQSMSDCSVSYASASLVVES